MDTKDRSIPAWKVVAHLGFQILLIAALVLEVFADHTDRALFFALLIVALRIEDKIDEHFGDLRRRDTLRGGTYVRTRF